MQVDWKNSATKPVLRLLADSDLALSATSIVYNLNKQLERPPSRATVHRALSGALEAELVHQPEGALYEITDTGRKYLTGDLRADEIEVTDSDQQ
ncbi:ArsR family transcriptional regulator [Salinibaculum rarum]|uniref:ArsR family transcriptional regulator n=1 Tax=Salinibaculum rarum TaxID=3058903 RepID=UPI00265F9966|nr:ArsR family transcriptional regulator [Salinibaculum sp. KK48]